MLFMYVLLLVHYINILNYITKFDGNLTARRISITPFNNFKLPAVFASMFDGRTSRQHRRQNRLPDRLDLLELQ